MFSGIIQTVASVHSICNDGDVKKYSIILPKTILSDIKIGSSISNNGCCLTVINITKRLVSFHLIYETLKLTNMHSLKIGDLINIEKSICYCDSIDGHLMTGHIDCTGEIKKIINFSIKNTIMWIEIKKKSFKKYIFSQGSIGIDGVSITINRVLDHYIRICLTPYTYKNTTLGIKKIGDVVNIEIDYITKTIVKNVKSILLKTNLKMHNIL